MTERPIIMGGFSVRQTLDDNKTQTRRVIKPQPPAHEEVHQLAGTGLKDGTDSYGWIPGEGDPDRWRVTGPVWAVRELVRPAELRCPYGAPGDRLWVKEAWRPVERESDGLDGVLFRADDAFVGIENTVEAADLWGAAYNNGKYGTKWRSPLFLPRWASRISLEITGVRVERLQDISKDDAIAEGCSHWECGHPDCMSEGHYGPRGAFVGLWNTVNAKRGFAWESNPWVWVIEFKRVA